jgi:beta-phosphoglucomutase
MKYAAILFDLDGVIVDSEMQHYQAFKSTFSEYGIALSKQQFKDSFIGKTDKASFIDFFGESKSPPIELNELMTKKSRYYARLIQENVPAYPDAITCITALKAQQQLMGLVTGSLMQEVKALLEGLDLATMFTVIITAEDVIDSKPSPEGYLKAAKVLSVSPENCLVVEDAPKGVSAARSANMHCLAVTHTYPAAMLDGATAIVDQLRITDF